MKTVLVYDRINKWGGAERVLLSLHELYPDAPLYTAVYDKKRAVWADDFDVRTTFLQRIPFVRSRHEYLPLLTPAAFDSLSFPDIDLCISITSSDAKRVITRSNTLHVCYMLTPTRYLWSAVTTYTSKPGFGLFSILARMIFSRSIPLLRHWDIIGSKRPDAYIAISQRVADRIKKYYGITSTAVIYPPVDTDTYCVDSTRKTDNSYYLVVSRLVAYKRIDIVIAACNKLGKKLLVIGRGKEEKNLRQIAGTSIQFINKHLTDKELALYYQGCSAFLFAGDEDFGIVAAEAQACGKPVIAYRNSGISEIVRDNITGILFDNQSVDSLINALMIFKPEDFSSRECRKNAMRFSNQVFKKEFQNCISRLLVKYSKTQY